MYKKNQNHQFSLQDFNQPMGLKLDPENKWIKKAAMIPWDEIEAVYADLFPSDCGMPAKPLRMALGALLIQKKFGFSDRELVEQIQENPYYQYFIGLPGFQLEKPFAPSLMVEFRKRITDEKLAEINELIIDYNKNDHPSDGNSENKGTMIIDATCAPQNIAFPQDINLLNEARENLEAIISSVCYEYNLLKPRMYKNNARKDYLALAKCKKRSSKKIRKAIKKQLQYIRRDRNYIDWFMSYGYYPDKHQMGLDIPMLLSGYNDLKFASAMTVKMQMDGTPAEKWPDKCIGCGACASVCPQHIGIPGVLKEYNEMLHTGPTWAEMCRQREEAAEKMRKQLNE